MDTLANYPLELTVRYDVRQHLIGCGVPSKHVDNILALYRPGQLSEMLEDRGTVNAVAQFVKKTHEHILRYYSDIQSYHNALNRMRHGGSAKSVKSVIRAVTSADLLLHSASIY